MSILPNIKTYSSFVRIEHTLFSLPLIYGGALLAGKGLPSLKVALLILIAGFGARTAALSLNRIIDRKLDKQNPRTAGREIPSGTMNMIEALGVMLFGGIVYLVAAGFLSTFCLLLSPIPLFVFIIYPYLKHYTALAHFGVGLGLSMAPLGGWFAVSQSFRDISPALLLGVFTLCWVSGFDIIYSTLDEEFDRTAGLYSFPSRLGKRGALRISALLHLFAFLSLALLYLLELRNLPALPFLVLAGIMLYLEHHKAEDVELAFFKINAVVGFVVFFFILAGIL